MILDWLTKDNITPARTIIQMMFNTMPETLWSMEFSITTPNGSSETLVCSLLWKSMICTTLLK